MRVRPKIDIHDSFTAALHTPLSLYYIFLGNNISLKIYLVKASLSNLLQ